eukprot:2428515-Rhodomonas_salina.3
MPPHSLLAAGAGSDLSLVSDRLSSSLLLPLTVAILPLSLAPRTSPKNSPRAPLVSITGGRVRLVLRITLTDATQTGHNRGTSKDSFKAPEGIEHGIAYGGATRAATNLKTLGLGTARISGISGIIMIVTVWNGTRLPGYTISRTAVGCLVSSLWFEAAKGCAG